MSKSKWIYKNLKSTEFNVLAEKFGVHPAIIKILADRGVQGEDAVREYLEADIATVSDGSELTDMQRGVDVIYDAVKAGKYIRIMGMSSSATSCSCRWSSPATDGSGQRGRSPNCISSGRRTTPSAPHPTDPAGSSTCLHS